MAAGWAVEEAVSAARCSPRLELLLSLIPHSSQTARAEVTVVGGVEATKVEPTEGALTEDLAVQQRRMEVLVDLVVAAGEEAAR